MPFYSFKNTETGEEFEEVMSNASREEFLAKNPHIIQTIQKARLTTSRGGIKPADGFRDMLKAMKKANPGSTIDTY